MELARLYKECKKVTINQEEYISTKARSDRSCAIAAKWPGVVGIDPRGEAPFRIAHVVSFIEHALSFTSSDSLTSISKNHIFARVQWYCDHPRRDFIHSSVILCANVFDCESCACFIPVTRIMCRCAISSPISLRFDYGFDNVLVAVPLFKHSVDFD